MTFKILNNIFNTDDVVSLNLEERFSHRRYGLFGKKIFEYSLLIGLSNGQIITITQDSKEIVSRRYNRLLHNSKHLTEDLDESDIRGLFHRI
jgi:hypothetical protein